MEIHYIWIKNYQSIQQSGINLSSRFIIEMENIKKHSETTPFDTSYYNIKIKDNEYLANFFERENIVNVNAIIGKNGSGKSSILKYIIQHFTEDRVDHIREDVIVYSIFNGNKEEFYVLHPKKMQLTPQQDKQEPKFRFISNPGHLGNVIREHFSENSYIYYSYLLDYNTDLQHLETSDFKNLSTSFLLSEKRRDKVKEFEEMGLNRDELDANSDQDYLMISEVSKAIELITQKNNLDIDFIPDSLNIIITGADELFINSKKNSITPSLSHIKDILSKLRNKLNGLSGKDLFLSNLALSIFANFCRTHLERLEKFKFHGTNETSKLKLLDFVKVFIGEFLKDQASNGGTKSLYKDFVGNLDQFIKKIEELVVIDNKLEIARISNDVYTIVIGKDTKKDFEELISYYLKVKGNTHFLEFKWRSMSGGEQSFLSFMARFHALSQDFNKLNNKKDLVILIDEGDIGFHPEWQKKFFNQSIEFLSKTFRKNRLQLIFTANTPFLTSDLPKSHIIFLNKEKDSPVEVLGKNNTKENTFGANIHTLFSNSFYMEGILMGDFAKKKIDIIISYLTNPKEESVNEEYRKTINEIGEPVIKRKLQMMWTEKFGLDEQIRAAEDQLAELLKKKKLKK